MKIAVPKERQKHEKRVSVTPDIVKKYISLGLEVLVEKGAGKLSHYEDQHYVDAGAKLVSTTKALLSNADIILKVQGPSDEQDAKELAVMKKNALLIGQLSPYKNPKTLERYAASGLSTVSLELVPRITRAQGMDVLSSQSNLAGYRAVLDAAHEYDRGMPMMMTAAGTVAPARVMVLGAGVAGLQAIATAKRLGAVVSATDVRPAAKEQVESLGGKFVMVDSEETRNAETAGGYAKEMSDDFKRQQAELVSATLRKQDIVICTALIPGRQAPTLITDTMVESMRPGSIIVDLAVEQGGNCTLSEPGKIVDVGGVRIIGHYNFPSRIAADASALYAKNIYNFLEPLLKQDSDAEKTSQTPVLKLNMEDEIIAATVLTHEGKIVHPTFAPETTSQKENT